MNTGQEQYQNLLNDLATEVATENTVITGEKPKFTNVDLTQLTQPVSYGGENARSQAELIMQENNQPVENDKIQEAGFLNLGSFFETIWRAIDPPMKSKNESALKIRDRQRSLAIEDLKGKYLFHSIGLVGVIVWIFWYAVIKK